MNDEQEPMHVDHFIDYGTSCNPSKRSENEDYARWIFLHFRLPAVTKMAFDKFIGDKKLFCTYDGDRYRVTGASRLGDVWLTKDFNQHTGYQKRVDVSYCSTWGKEA